MKTFCEALLGKFKLNVRYCIRGSRPGKSILYNKIFVYIKDYVRYVRILRNNSFDLVHINISLGHGGVLRDIFFITVAKIFNVKVLLFFHGWDIAFERNIKKYFFKIFKLIYFKVDAICFVGTVFKDKVESWGYNGLTYLVSSVMDENLLAGLSKDELFKNRKKQSKNINILFLARVELDKGIMETIQAFNIVKKSFKDVKLIVAGDGTKLDYVKYYVKKNRIYDVEFTGYITGKAKIEKLIRSHIFILPTYHGEGMPHSLLEAMGFGLPVITRPIAGTRDFFRNRMMGFITESKNPEVFAEFIVELIKDDKLRYEISSFNYDFIRENYSSSKIVKRLEDIYSVVIHS
ncbi:MAG: glycosyltransferase family 4 protein [Elusimicrobiota bacterium]